MVFLMNVSIVLDPDPYPISDLLPLVTGSLVPLAAVLCYLLWRREPDHRPAVVLRRASATMIVLAIPLLLFTFGEAMSKLAG